MELYFFFGATISLILRLPTILWGFCEPKNSESERSANDRTPRRRNGHRHIRSTPVYVTRIPNERAVFPAPPPLPPPPFYDEIATISGSTVMDDQKLPTYEQVVASNPTT